MTDEILVALVLALQILAFVLMAVLEVQEVRCGFCHF